MRHHCCCQNENQIDLTGARRGPYFGLSERKISQECFRKVGRPMKVETSLKVGNMMRVIMTSRK